MFMNVFRKTLFLLLPVVLFGVMKAHAADPIFVVDSHYVTVEKLEYWSVDAFNNPILLSEEVYYNKYYSNFKSVLVSNHPTTTQDAIVPTGSDPQIGEVLVMCDGEDRCLVVAPDYLGYGTSKATTHPYMCTTLTARNVVDGVLAAMEYVKTKKTTRSVFNGYKSENYYFDSDYYTWNVGYSQGGAATLAVHKYLETEASHEVLDKIRLKKSICGAGPHLQTYMFDEMEQYDDMFYSLYIPYTIDGLMYTFGNTIMRGLKEEDIYTEKFLHSNLLATMRAKNIVAADLNTLIANTVGTNGKVNFYDIIRPEYRDRSSKLYRTIHKALSQLDLLDGWTPTLPIDFYHWTNDEVVPFQESQMAYDHFKSLGCDVTLKKAEDISVNSVWAIKSFDETHMGYGTKFYLSIFSGSLR